MGWSVYVQIVRDKPLTAAERKKLAAHARKFKLSSHSEDYVFRVAPEDAPGGVVAAALGKWGREPDPEEDEDAARMYAALTELRSLFRNTTLEVADDHHFVGWDGERYGIVDDPDQEMTAGPKDRSAWIEVPTPRPAPAQKQKPAKKSKLDRSLEAALAAVAAGEPVAVTDELVVMALAAIDRALRAKDHDLKAKLEAVLAVCPALDVVRLGLQGPPVLGGCGDAVAAAVARLDHLDDVRHRLVRWWFESAAPADAHVRFRRLHVMEPAMRDRYVVTELGGALVNANLDDHSADERHRQTMTLLIQSERGLPYAIYRRRADREKPQRQSECLLHDLVGSRRREILPTLVIELTRRRAVRDDMFRAMAYMDDPRVMPLLERALATDQYTRAVAETLWHHRNPRSEELLRGLLAHVDPMVRILAAQGLVAWHGDAALPRLLEAVAHAKAAGLWRARLFSSSSYDLENVRRKPASWRGPWPDRALTTPLPEVAIAAHEAVSAPVRMLSPNPDVRHDAITLVHHDALEARDRSRIKLLVAAERWHKAQCANADVSMYTWFEACSRVHVTNYWSSWRKLVKLPFDPMYKYDHVTWDWLDAHPDELGPQVMPDELAALTGKPAADPATRLCFGADELAAWDAEERALATS